MARIASDPRVKDALAGVHSSILVHFRNTPAERYQYLYARFEDGQVLDGTLGLDGDGKLAALPEPEFTIEGDYTVFASIQRGEISDRRALLSGKLHLHGPRLKALRLMDAFQGLTDVLAEIPCET